MKITFIKKDGRLIPYSEEDREKVDKFKDGAIYVCDIKNNDIRTLSQNRSIHLWCTQIAKTLNANSLSISGTIKSDVNWSMETVKEIIFKPIVKALYNKDSTTKLNRNEFEKIIDNIVLIFANKGVSLPEFPNRESLEFKSDKDVQ